MQSSTEARHSKGINVLSKYKEPSSRFQANHQFCWQRTTMFEKVSICQSMSKFHKVSCSIRFHQIRIQILRRVSAAGLSASDRRTSGAAQCGVPQRWCGDGWHRTFKTHDTRSHTIHLWKHHHLLHRGPFWKSYVGILWELLDARCDTADTDGYRYSGHFNSIKFKVFGHGTAA